MAIEEDAPFVKLASLESGQDLEAIVSGRSPLRVERTGSGSSLDSFSSSSYTVTSDGSSSTMEEIGAKKKGEGFGEKNISAFSGFALLTNSMIGPAVVSLPVVFQQAGWFSPLVIMGLILLISSFSASMLCQAMSTVPGNENFHGRVELSTLAKFLFPRWGFICTLLLLCISLLAINISSIIVSAQTMDYTLIGLFGWSCAIEFWPDPFTFVQATEPGDGISPFSGMIVISLGFVIVFIMTIPMGYFNLEDNMIIQNVAFFVIILVVLEWMVQFFANGLEFDRVPFVGDNQSQVLGTIIFNYAFVVTVPSWVNEKKETVSINKSIWASTFFSTFIFIILGLFGGWAFVYPSGGDLLSVLNSNSEGGPDWLGEMSQISVYLYPLVALLTGIPVFSIVIRYNLLENQLCSKTTANLFAVVLPWVISALLTTGEGIQIVINWTSLLVNGVINFIIPLLLFVVMRNSSPRKKLFYSESMFNIRKAYTLNVEESDDEDQEIEGRQRRISIDSVSTVDSMSSLANSVESFHRSYGAITPRVSISNEGSRLRGQQEADKSHYVLEHPFKAIPPLESKKWLSYKYNKVLEPGCIAMVLMVLAFNLIVMVIALDLYLAIGDLIEKLSG